MAMRVGVASIVQETNTFSPVPSTLDDFASQGIYRGLEMAERFSGTNTEAGGALAALAARQIEPVPLLRAWAMSSGAILRGELERLVMLLQHEIANAAPLDALVLSLHGALVTVDGFSGDLRLLRAARRALGDLPPIGVCLDLHANVTSALCEEADCIVGYLTYPHVDQGETGRRVADLLADRLEGSKTPVTRCAKRPMLIPPEAQGVEGPFGSLRRLADARVAEGCLDVSLYPVQPWLDVAELGFGVTVTTDGDGGRAAAVADELAEAAWRLRREFAVPLSTPEHAIGYVRRARSRPVILSESADSPTAGAAADSPAMVKAFLEFGLGLKACASVVDSSAVAQCKAHGIGKTFSGDVGCAFERRFHTPARLNGEIVGVGGGSFNLTGPAFSGMEVSMGDFAVVRSGEMQVLLTERPAPTFDPEAFRFAGIELASMDAIVIRSANLFRAGYRGLSSDVVFIDVPGASTPQLSRLPYERAPRPLFPLDDV